MVILSLLLATTPAHACNVPVFRYALERWPADPYEVLVFHRGPLEENDRTMIESLAKQVDSEAVNLAVQRIDLAEPVEEKLREVYEAQREPRLPWLVVRNPASAQVWAGPLGSATLPALIDSPARRTLAQRLLDGESAVWLLLESGDAQRDAASAAMVQSQLKKLENELKLPTLTASPEDRVSEEGPALRLAFSLLRVGRADPAERMLVQMLLHSEPDLTDRIEPMVFPVFGRGRALYALVGAGITEDNIQEAAGTLVGACRCEVKKLNPGLDLVMAVNWNERIKGRQVKDAEPPPLVGLSGFLPETTAQPPAGDRTIPQELPLLRPAERDQPDALSAASEATPFLGPTITVFLVLSAFLLVAAVAGTFLMLAWNKKRS